MKQTIRVRDKKSGKIIKGEVKLRDFDHFQIQLKNKSHVFKPKKGKGSYRRKSKYGRE